MSSSGPITGYPGPMHVLFAFPDIAGLTRTFNVASTRLGVQNLLFNEGIVGQAQQTPDQYGLLRNDGNFPVVVGDATKPVKPLAGSHVPLVWGEDHLLPRMPDGNGFMRDTLAPGGCIYKVDPDGKKWELISNGFRNEFDAAFKRTIDDVHRRELAFYEDEVKSASSVELRGLAERRVTALRKNLVERQAKQEKDW